MSGKANFGLKAYGAGIGLRRQHFQDILRDRPDVGWLEVIPENFINRGGYCADAIKRIGEVYPLIAHGVSLSIGSTDPLDREHLGLLKQFCDDVGSAWVSDHLCFTMVDHLNLNDLIPLPFREETVRHVAGRVKVVQEFLERPFLLENVTYYMTPSRSEMSEAQFVRAILEEADCGLLLDVSNVVLNSKNHGYDPQAFIRSLPMERIGHLHLAGYEQHGDVLLDTHAKPVSDETWDLYKFVIEQIGRTSVLVEWDAEIPTLARLCQEAEMAQRFMDEITWASPAKGAP